MPVSSTPRATQPNNCTPSTIFESSRCLLWRNGSGVISTYSLIRFRTNDGTTYPCLGDTSCVRSRTRASPKLHGCFRSLKIRWRLGYHKVQYGPGGLGHIGPSDAPATE